MTAILRPGQRVTIEGQDYTVQPRAYREVRDQLLILAFGAIGAVAALVGAVLILS